MKERERERERGREREHEYEYKYEYSQGTLRHSDRDDFQKRMGEKAI